MRAVLQSLLLALGQIADRAVLRVLAKSLAITVLIFAALGAATFQAIAFAAAYLGAGIGSGSAYLITVVLAVVAFWLLFRIVAIAVLQFFADEVVRAVEQRHYPVAAANARELPFAEDFANSLQGAMRALVFNALAAVLALLLIFTAIGPAAIFLLVNAVLLGRELTDMGWLRHRPSPVAASPVSRLEQLLLGGAIAALMAVPLANLLAPIIGAAAGTHLVQLSLRKANQTQSHA
ncbi:MAG: EI24 domain-containing protein [Erythrobacter sp.]